jgi:mannosyltransferase
VSVTQSPPRSSRSPEEATERRAHDPGATSEIVILAVVVTVVGVVLRFVAQTPLWLDEALSANIAALPVGEIPEALRQDGHPPLYYVLLHGWMELFGTGDAAVRSLSGVLSVATLPLAWLAGRRRGGPSLAWISLALFAFAPFALRYATETRMYALVMLLVLAGYLLLDDVLRSDRVGPARVIGLALITALLLYTHYWSLWLLAAVGTVALWLSFRAGAQQVRHNARVVMAALAAGGVVFIPWLPTMLYQAAHTGTPWAGAQRPTSMLAVTLGDFGGAGFRDAEFIGTLFAFLFVLGVFGRAITRSRIMLNLRTETQFRYETIIVLLTLGFGAAVAFVTASAYASRYAAVFFPVFWLVVAGGVTRFAHRWIRFGVLATMLVLSTGGAYFNVTDQRSQARDIGADVTERAQPGDVVVYCPDQLGPAGSREMRADLDQVVYPTLEPPQRIDWVDYAERNDAADPPAIAAQVVDRAGPDRGIFVVWNGEYRTFTGQCELLVDSLAVLRPGAQTIEPSGAGKYFEFATVVHYPPPG